jgi:cytochrome c556
MRSKFGKAAALAAAMITAAAGAALAHDLGPVPNTPGGKAAAARHENFKQLGGAFKAINDELKKDSPDKAVISANAQKMQTLAKGMPSWFPKGSGPETGLKIKAKAQVWSDPKGFAAAVSRLQGETTKLAQLSAGDDVDALKGQVRATGGACKNCHDNYRTPEER